MIKKIKNPVIATSRFLIVPQPLPDEILSSWIARTAYAHHTHPQTFLNLHFDNVHFNWRLNYDASVSDQEMEVLSQKSGLSYAKIYEMTLRSYEGSLRESIIPIGYNRYIALQQNFCPVCLREDPFPYFRKSWKILLLPVCLKHQCYLYDSCPSCQSKVRLLNMFNTKSVFTLCHKCGYDLKKAKKLTVSKSLFPATRSIRSIQSILNRGYTVLAKKAIYSFLFFEVFVQLAKVIITYKRVSTLDYEANIASFRKKRRFSKARPVIEQLSTRQLLLVLASIMGLFKNYPHIFDRYVKANQLGHWPLSRDMKKIPFWYDQLLDRVAPKDCFMSDLVTVEEIQSAVNWLKNQGIEPNKMALQRIFGCNFYNNSIGKDLFKI